MKAWILKNGAFESCDSLPLSDRGFRYGMAIFESFPVRDGVAFFLEAHFEKLRVAAQCVDFALPEIPLTAILSLAETLVGTWFARIYVTAGDGAPTANRDLCRVYFFAEERAFVSAEIYERGYRMTVSDEPYHSLFRAPFGGLKTANYWKNVEALRRAKANGFDEVLLVNASNEAVSASMANLFIVKNGAIQTPPLASGARAGVVREWVMAQREVAEIPLTTNDLQTADEIFLTSSWFGVMPVTQFKTRMFSTPVIAQSLLASYSAAITSSR